MNRNNMIFGDDPHMIDEMEARGDVKHALEKVPAFSAAVSIVIASIYSGNCPREHVCDLLYKVHEASLAALAREEGQGTAGIMPATNTDRMVVPVPAVPVNESVHEDYIICLEDGKKLQLLKRYLRRAYGMTPEQYKLRWGLPDSYPMIAPSLSEKRSMLVRDVKPYLARKRRKEPEFA